MLPPLARIVLAEPVLALVTNRHQEACRMWLDDAQVGVIYALSVTQGALQ